MMVAIKLNNIYCKLIILSLLVKIFAIIFFGNILFHNGTMMGHYNRAAILADHGFIGINEEFRIAAFNFNNKNKLNTDYYKLTENIVTKNNINRNPELTDTYGYTVLLGKIWKLTGIKSYIFIQIFQIMIDLLATIAIFSITFDLFKKKVIAIFSTVLYSLFLPFAVLSVIPARDYFAAWGIIFSLLFFLKYEKINKNYYLILSGLVIAFFSWFRSSIFIIPLIYVLYAFFVKDKSYVFFIKTALLIFLPVFMFFVIPFSLQYHDRYSTYNFTSGFSGNNLWEGLGEFPNKYNFVCNDSLALERAYQLGYPKNSPFGTPEFSSVLRVEAINVIKNDPMFYVNTLFKRYTRYIFAKPILGITEKTGVYYKDFNGGIFEFLKQHPIVFFENAVKNILAYLIPILSVIAIFIFKNYRKEILFLLAIWQFKILFHVTTHLEDRYVLEAYFPLIIILGLYGNAIYEKCFSARNKRENIFKFKLS